MAEYGETPSQQGSLKVSSRVQVGVDVNAKVMHDLTSPGQQ